MPAYRLREEVAKRREAEARAAEAERLLHRLRMLELARDRLTPEAQRLAFAAAVDEHVEDQEYEQALLRAV